MSSVAQAQAGRSTIDSAAVSWSTNLMERGLLPEWLIRVGIRRLLRERLREEDKGDVDAQQAHLSALIENLKAGPIALATDAANDQHYEVPAKFFQLVLGKNLKYSSAYWADRCSSLNEAEEAMLGLTSERAQLADGQRILELGCGWGSLTLYVAQRFPHSQITAVSNSHSQRQFIEARARERGVSNVQVITADMNSFTPSATFDRVVSVEMFEHMRNYEALLARVASWLQPDGKLFVHIFTHRKYSYPFEIRDASDWMAKHFFTGGMMPGTGLLLYFQRDLRVEQHWQMSGRHYQKTAQAWLKNMDLHRHEILELMAETYAGDSPAATRRIEATRWFVRWKVFFLACEELWGYRAGQEWTVSHYLFQK